MRGWQRLLLLAALLGAAAAAERELHARDGVFVGYKEAGVDSDKQDAAADQAAAAAGDGKLNVAREGGADAAGAADGGGQQAAGGAQQADEAAAAAKEAEAAALAKVASVVGRTVVLHTQFGPIKVKLLEQLAPKTTALVWQLAQARGCKDCAFYRNEAKPKVGQGPPYALLQGRLPELADKAPLEGAIEVKMGHVCFIPGTNDFFIAYGDHPEWGTAHTVWGLVDEWFATDFIISQRYKTVTHPEYGTEMRMLLQEVPVRIAAEGDKTWSGLLGPLRDP
ncbi:peptidyl-prolyl cis- cyclophilin type [Chlorella sorokiniana]|uniref:Peptidyl-prolyl cis-cyclophilin type n=1 Tax=Chlorella sorokiniana TaxID=3076 RepID=A0A2P6TLH1_CHLSO|nr:peptidyl-prolyl cis- cyclophilin type [Chlorella sorokiniana]|eukprot:PRW45096.1 peptidyl-prolyl cis- cyclophilin type [Chlorella sorokiniana]